MGQIFTDRPLFLSTLSLRRATPETGAGSPNADISIHALLAESDMGVFESEHDMCISIHALLAESDQTNGSTTIPNFNFYPRSPCGERPHDNLIRLQQAVFLSTLSLRRATPKIHQSQAEPHYFYPRSPCGERRVTVLGIQHRVGISIHALLAESDVGRSQGRWQPDGFLSTLSLRRATGAFARPLAA